jgi:hypothetical protein
VEEDVLLLGQRIWHRVTGGYGRQEPKRVVEVRQQAYVGVGEGRLSRAELQVVDLGGRASAADDVEPLLHVVLIPESGLYACGCA